MQTLRYNEEKLMEKLCQQSTRLLRIGATKSIGEYVLLPNIKRFLSFPEHEIEFLVDNTERLLERLDHSELDFVVLEGIFISSITIGSCSGMSRISVYAQKIIHLQDGK